MGPYISLSLEIGGRALIGAWALKGMNTVFPLWEHIAKPHLFYCVTDRLYVLKCIIIILCRSRKFCKRGSNFDGVFLVFFFILRERGSKQIPL